MKNIVIIITILTLLFCSSVGVAADSNLKDIEVILSEIPTVAKIGEIIDLTATTQKHGSTYTDTWDNAVKSATVYDITTGTYISKALFTAEKSGIYTISYTINMTSGNSDTVFLKKVERTIEVIDTTTVIGAAIKDLKITPIFNTDGSISAYSAYATTHALWSNNTTTPNGSVYFFFAPEETTKDIVVTLNVNGQQYNYTITVNR
jgi:hypothetical protein